MTSLGFSQARKIIFDKESLAEDDETQTSPNTSTITDSALIGISSSGGGLESQNQICSEPQPGTYVT